MTLLIVLGDIIIRVESRGKVFFYAWLLIMKQYFINGNLMMSKSDNFWYFNNWSSRN